MWTIFSRIWLTVWIVCAALPDARAGEDAALRVFAAASLTDAMAEALALCAPDAVGVYAGSGALARQIDQGAPADLYVSASPQWMDWLARREAILPATRTDLLGNRLALVARPGDPPPLTPDSRLALANVESVPAGVYARQALAARGLWPRPDPRRTLQAANVREALAWVARGEADYGVVYVTDARAEPRVTLVETFEDSAHDPIRYPAALVAGRESPRARALLACLGGPQAAATFRAHGFAPP